MKVALALLPLLALTLLIGRREGPAVTTGEHELWQRIYDWTAHVECQQPCTPFKRISPRLPSTPSLVEVPAHPPAFAALVALMVAPFHPRPETLEQKAAVAIALLAWLAIAGACVVLAAALKPPFGERGAVTARSTERTAAARSTSAASSTPPPPSAPRRATARPAACAARDRA